MDLKVLKLGDEVQIQPFVGASWLPGEVTRIHDIQTKVGPPMRSVFIDYEGGWKLIHKDNAHLIRVYQVLR